MKPLPNDAARRYESTGYAIFPEVLDDGELLMLRQTCAALLDEPPDDDQGGAGHDIGRGHDRRFLRHRHTDFPELEAFILGPDMKDFLSTFIGRQPHLFNEQFVVKGPNTGSGFAWHQDSGYIPFRHRPYITVWMALDDTTVENGAVHVLPRPLEGEPSVIEHRWDESGKEYVGYDGDDPGIPAEVPAGSIVAFSSLTLHRSSGNTTDRARRSYVAQYSGEPILDPDTGRNRRFATPL